MHTLAVPPLVSRDSVRGELGPRNLNKRLRQILVLGAALALSAILALIAAKRGDTYDTAIYREYFTNCHAQPVQWSYFDDQHIEIGFQLVTRLVFSVTENVQVYFFLITFAGLLCVVRVAGLLGFNRTSVLVYFGCSLFPLLFLVQMRQGLADCVAFCGLAYFCRQQTLRAWVFLLVACTIHVSAFLIVLTLTGYIICRASGLSIPSMVVVFTLALCLGKYWLYSTTWSRVEYYLTNPEFNVSANILRLSTLKYLGVAVAAAMLSRRSVTAQGLLTAICFSAVLIRVIFADNSAFSGRLGASLTFGEIFMVPWLFRRCGQRVFWLGFPSLCIISLYYLLYIEHPEILALY